MGDQKLGETTGFSQFFQCPDCHSQLEHSEGQFLRAEGQWEQWVSCGLV